MISRPSWQFSHHQLGRSSGQEAAVTDFVGPHAPHVFLTPAPVGAPYIGAVESLGLLIADEDPHDGLCISPAGHLPRPHMDIGHFGSVPRLGVTDGHHRSSMRLTGAGAADVKELVSCPLRRPAA